MNEARVGPGVDAGYEARVLRLPVERSITAARKVAATVVRPLAPYGTWTVDDWGRDPRLVDVVGFASRARWKVSLGGADHLPRRRSGLVVVNARRFALAPIFTALALASELDRPVRFVGRPDVAPFGAGLRRLGGLLDRPDEILGALRAGELVVMGARPEQHPRRVGRVDHHLIGTAVASATPVYPAASASSPFSRRARVEIGPAVRPSRRRRGPLAEVELADVVRARIQLLLDELGGMRTGTPMDWLPLSGMGGS